MKTAEGQGQDMPTHDYDDRIVTATHVVKGEDLNHHNTLYGGRCVEWCVEAAYMAAENCFDEARAVVFMSIRSLSMRAPARIGEMIEFVGRVDYVGESTIGIRVDARKLQPREERKPVATGTFLFCTVDERGQSMPHGLPALAAASETSKGRWRDVEEASFKRRG